MILFFLASGLFLGWSLGANDAANVFGTAVGSRMIRFTTAAIIASIFVIIGAVAGGAGAAHTLGALGSVNALAGSFMVALAAAFTVYTMTRFSLPVSTSQAVVGAIIGWNFFSGAATDSDTLTKIVLTWVLCPVLAAIFSVILYYLTRVILAKIKIHLLRQDFYTRWGLLLVGAFGSYSLGANNIANVMGVFVPAIHFEPISLFGILTLSGAQQLFLVGGIAIAVGIYTYSHNVMKTVGSGLFKLSPETALIVVLAQALVLFLFSSQHLEAWLLAHSLPAIPLVPVSSSQAVVGGIIGIGIAKGGRNIQFDKLGRIASGWVTTPLIAGIIAFVGLFFLQNVFTQEVSKKMTYTFTPELISHLQQENIDISPMGELLDREFSRSGYLQKLIKNKGLFSDDEIAKIIAAAKNCRLTLAQSRFANLDTSWFSPTQFVAIQELADSSYTYLWQLHDALVLHSQEWAFKEKNKLNKLYNSDILDKLDYLKNNFGN
ncbi:MAG TPA: inorganic phosphate transporter [Candidatus Marinimicrobia bacterium]|nr:inorganic phosphate transporter [Candidatus Neomarinimicrobiota bacterium]